MARGAALPFGAARDCPVDAISRAGSGLKLRGIAGELELKAR